MIEPNNLDKLRDLTQRLEIAEGEQYRFFHLAHDLMCICEKSGTFRKVSPSWQITLGYTPEQLTSRPFIEFVHNDDRPKTVEAIEKLRNGEPVFGFVNRYKNINGLYHFLQWNANYDPVTDLIYAVARDVTSEMNHYIY